MYLLQKPLFSFEQWLEIESSERLGLFFTALDLEPYANKLKSASPHGAKPINREAILRALLAAPFIGRHIDVHSSPSPAGQGPVIPVSVRLPVG